MTLPPCLPRGDCVFVRVWPRKSLEVVNIDDPSIIALTWH
jgi:hypothetical protein